MTTNKKSKPPANPAKAPAPARSRRKRNKSAKAEKPPAKKAVAKRRRVVAKKPVTTGGTKLSTAKKSKAHRPRAMLKPEHVVEIFKRFKKIDPEPKGELESVNTFTFLVAVVLSAQATDVGVNKATHALFKTAPTPEKMVKIGELRLREFIKTIGLFRTKAKNVIALSQLLIDKHGSTIPQNRDTLETLPGVGRKTANVVMNVAFGEPTMAVDTHVLRVSNRTGISNGKNPLAVEKHLLKKIPQQYAVPAHHWLILHGRYLCKARKPECWRCPIADLCQYPEKTATV